MYFKSVPHLLKCAALWSLFPLYVGSGLLYAQEPLPGFDPVPTYKTIRSSGGEVSIDFPMSWSTEDPRNVKLDGMAMRLLYHVNDFKRPPSHAFFFQGAMQPYSIKSASDKKKNIYSSALTGAIVYRYCRPSYFFGALGGIISDWQMLVIQPIVGAELAVNGVHLYGSVKLKVPRAKLEECYKIQKFTVEESSAGGDSKAKKERDAKLNWKQFRHQYAGDMLSNEGSEAFECGVRGEVGGALYHPAFPQLGLRGGISATLIPNSVSGTKDRTFFYEWGAFAELNPISLLRINIGVRGVGFQKKPGVSIMLRCCYKRDLPWRKQCSWRQVAALRSINVRKSSFFEYNERLCYVDA